MDIGIVCEQLNVVEHGGSNFSIHRLATELSDRGHSVDVVTLNFNWENNPPKNVNYDVITKSIENHTYIDAVLKTVRNVDDIVSKYDIVHVYQPGIQPVFGMWRKQGGKTPIIGHLNAYTPFCSNASKMKQNCWENCTLENKISHSNKKGRDLLLQIPKYTFNTHATIPLMNQLDGFVALSPAVEEIYAGVGIDKDLLNVIPNMLDPSFKNHQLDTDRNSDTKTYICYVGRVDQQKGVDTLIDALGRLPDNLEYHVDIVGDDILERDFGIDNLKAQTQSMGIDSKVTFHGWVDYSDLSSHYAEADIFVHPGRWPEPFGRTLLEALQSNCAVVTSDVGAPPWIAGKAGLSFPREDSVALAEQLQKLIKNKGLVKELQANCNEELKRFTPKKVTSQIESLYQNKVENESRA